MRPFKCIEPSLVNHVIAGPMYYLYSQCSAILNVWSLALFGFRQLSYGRHTRGEGATVPGARSCIIRSLIWYKVHVVMILQTILTKLSECIAATQVSNEHISCLHFFMDIEIILLLFLCSYLQFLGPIKEEKVKKTLGHKIYFYYFQFN